MLFQIMKDWLWIERCEWMKREQLAQIQEKKLKEMVKHAFEKVSFYHNLYTLAGVEPDRTNMNTLSSIPIITKQQARAVQLKERTARDIDINSCNLRRTSGSTGIPVTVMDEVHTSARRAALWLRRFWSYGIRPIDRVCLFAPGEHYPGIFTASKSLAGYLIHRKIKRLSLAKTLQEHLRLISKWKPTVLIGPTSYYRSLISALEEEGQHFDLKVVIANAEMLDGKTRNLISDTFNTENVFETYGAVEVGPMAWECPTHSGYHINAESIIMENLKDGDAVNPGEPGELCVTNLYRRATPFIRYLIGDIVILSEDECSCGRGLPILKEKQGRRVDFIKIKDGTQLSPFRIIHMIEYAPNIAQYKVIQESDGSISVLIQPLRHGDFSFLEPLKRICDELFHGMRFEIKTVDKIKTEKGKKYRIIESRLDNR